MGRYEKILGGLLGAAVGDAMGAPTETRSTSQIKEKFGGLVTTFLTPPDDVFARGFPAGSVTDDFSLAYYTAEAIIEDKGNVDEKTANSALIKWSESPFFKLAGPTTCTAICKAKGIPSPYENSRFTITYDNAKASNGSAMKISPVGLLSGGDIDKAIKDAITICLPTHFNSISLSAACAVSAAVAAAMHEDATIDSIISAALKGALEGETYGIANNRELSCPSVYKRIVLAKEIAQQCNGDMGRAMQELKDIIGSGLAAAEAVPTAFGLFVAANGDADKAIIAGVNIGNDTDTVATIAGAIAGTYSSYYREDFLKTINEVNNYNLEELAGKIDGILK